MTDRDLIRVERTQGHYEQGQDCQLKFSLATAEGQMLVWEPEESNPRLQKFCFFIARVVGHGSMLMCCRIYGHLSAETGLGWATIKQAYDLTQAKVVAELPPLTLTVEAEYAEDYQWGV